MSSSGSHMLSSPRGHVCSPRCDHSPLSPPHTGPSMWDTCPRPPVCPVMSPQLSSQAPPSPGQGEAPRPSGGHTPQFLSSVLIMPRSCLSVLQPRVSEETVREVRRLPGLWPCIPRRAGWSAASQQLTLAGWRNEGSPLSKPRRHILSSFVPEETEVQRRKPPAQSHTAPHGSSFQPLSLRTGPSHTATGQTPARPSLPSSEPRLP